MANRKRTDGEKLRAKMTRALADAATEAGTPGLVWDAAEEEILAAACRAADIRQRLQAELTAALDAGGASAARLARLSCEIRQCDTAVVRNVRLLNAGLESLGRPAKRQGSVQRIEQWRNAIGEN